MKITVEDEDGYQIRATKYDMGTFALIAIEWMHPNWSYFSDGMLWINSLHLQKWIPLHVAKWFERYSTKELFLQDFPQFSHLFSEI